MPRDAVDQSRLTALRTSRELVWPRSATESTRLLSSRHRTRPNSHRCRSQASRTSNTLPAWPTSRPCPATTSPSTEASNSSSRLRSRSYTSEPPHQAPQAPRRPTTRSILTPPGLLPDFTVKSRKTSWFPDWRLKTTL